MKCGDCPYPRVRPRVQGGTPHTTVCSMHEHWVVAVTVLVPPGSPGGSQGAGSQGTPHLSAGTSAFAQRPHTRYLLLVKALGPRCHGNEKVESCGTR